MPFTATGLETTRVLCFSTTAGLTGFAPGPGKYCHLDSRVNLLINRRPSSVQSRIHPGALHEYRVKHQMLGPCCLCPLKDANGPDFKEAAIYMTNSGLFSGEYIASCATGDCGYLGKLNEKYTGFEGDFELTFHSVPLERMYTQFGLVIKNYPLRGRSNYYFPGSPAFDTKSSSRRTSSTQRVATLGKRCISASTNCAKAFETDLCHAR